GLSGRVQGPPEDLFDRKQLAGVTRPPQRRCRTLVENPARSQVDNPLAVALSGELIETPHGSEILGVAWRLEFRVRQSKIVALELRVLLEFAGQQPAAQRAVSQGGEARLQAIRQEVGLDLALEQIIGRLHDMELRDAAESLDLGNREIAHSNGADLSLLEERLH